MHCCSRGAIVTIDAMGCQREIAQKIVEAGADYVPAVKENQSAPLGRIRAALDAIERVPTGYLDCFSEDQCRARVNNAAQNFAILRRIALNLLRQDRTTKAGLKNRRMLACADERYLGNSSDGLHPLKPRT
jgi:predicted transposase YbfD/YdcC